MSENDLMRTLNHQAALLSFESQRDYGQLENAIRDHIDPRDVWEKMWTLEIVECEWERQRLHRYKAKIIGSAKLTALRSLLNLICVDVSDREIDDLARRWFTNKGIRRKINSMLRSFELDESAIQAEAYRLCIGDLAMIDRRLAELAARRDKIFRQVEDYRAGLSALPDTKPSHGLAQGSPTEHVGDV
jgi:hypothetical protein